jgi:SAM-dependent methyltransferase
VTVDSTPTAGGIPAHYTRGGLLDAILGALAAAGKDPEHPGPDDLVPVEEFHTLGRPATLALAEAAGLREGERVLDAGSGVGGPARTLAGTFGCTVTGVDATPELCEVAAELDRRTGLAGQVRVVAGDALALPFRDGAFDVAWTQHVSMNIADKARFFRELRRAIRPGGRLALFDVVAGPTRPVRLPLMWAEDPSLNFLSTPEDLRRLLEELGFTILVWEDLSGPALAFYRMAAAATPAQVGPLSMNLLIPNLGVKVANMAVNLEEDRLRLLRCVARAG